MIETIPPAAARLSRRETAEALTRAGYRTAPATLATRASRGGGPPYEIFNGRAIYTFGTALAWAQAASEPRGGACGSRRTRTE